MQIKKISDVSDISEMHLDQLYLLQKQCWGSEPFREFQICNDCSRIYSTQEVLGSQDVSAWQVNFSCSACNTNTSDIYDKSFIEEIRNYLHGNVCLILAMSLDDSIQGFWVMAQKSVRDIVSYEFDTRPASYNAKDLEQSLSQKLFGDIQSGYREALLLHQIYVTPEFRSLGLAYMILKSMFQSFSDALSLPTILETRYDSKFYSITRTLGFQDTDFPDQYGYIPQFLPDSSHILSAIESVKHRTSQLSLYSWLAQGVLDTNPWFTAPRYYISPKDMACDVDE